MPFIVQNINNKNTQLLLKRIWKNVKTCIEQIDKKNNKKDYSCIYALA